VKRTTLVQAPDGGDFEGELPLLVEVARSCPHAGRQTAVEALPPDAEVADLADGKRVLCDGNDAARKNPANRMEDLPLANDAVDPDMERVPESWSVLWMLATAKQASACDLISGKKRDDGRRNRGKVRTGRPIIEYSGGFLIDYRARD
jgi:hypothetical protein